MSNGDPHYSEPRSDDIHALCALDKSVAVLKQKSIDDDKALIIAKDVASARWTAIIAVLVGLINFVIMLLKIIKGT
jgi:hypothetical protein